MAVAGRAAIGTLIKRGPASAAWIIAADVSAILLALVLPWSTSLVSVFAVLLAIAVVPFMDVDAMRKLLRQPASAFAIALFALAVIGMLWSPAPWSERLHGVSPAAKLLMLPLLFHHFERSERGEAVFIAFLVSCVLLSVMSWIVMLRPELSLKSTTDATRGIFVKDYIDQSQEFALCAVALAYPLIGLLRERRVWPAIFLCATGLCFVANMAFVIVSRTALVTMPIMLGIFGLLHLKWRFNLMIACAVVAVAAIAWVASPQLEWTVKTFSRDYQLYKEGVPTSIAERFEYWGNALRFIAEAPLVGHGTGSSKGLYEEAAKRPDWIVGVRVFPNPHNQTLNVGIQWGLLGMAVLYAMWIAHLLMFRGDGLANWIGLLVVVQNIFTSLFNSHIFDFHEGWMYVLGVGVAGGMMMRTRANDRVENAVRI